MEKAVANSTYFEGVTPRWLSIADFANSTNFNLTSPGILLILDTLKEVQIGLGREFSKTVLKNREAFVTKSLLKYLNIDWDQNSQVQLVIDLRKYFNLLFALYKNSDLNSNYYSDFNLYPIFKDIYEKITNSELNSQKENIFVIRVNFTIVESFESPNGKFADSYGNVMVIDWNYIIPTISEAFIKNIEKVTNDKLLLEDLK